MTVQGASSEVTQLQQQCQQSLTATGFGKTVCDNLTGAESDLGAGNATNACGVLAAFLKKVDAPSQKDIDPSDVAALVAGAQDIQAVLSC